MAMGQTTDNTQARNNAASIKSSCVAGGKAGDQRSSNVKQLVDPHRPDTTDAVIQQEREKRPNSCSEIDERDNVGDGAVIDMVFSMKGRQL